MFEATNSKGLIPFTEVIPMLGMSRSGVNKLRAKDPTFPKPIKFSESRQAKAYFRLNEVQAWVDSQGIAA